MPDDELKSDCVFTTDVPTIEVKLTDYTSVSPYLNVQIKEIAYVRPFSQFVTEIMLHNASVMHVEATVSEIQLAIKEARDAHDNSEQAKWE